MDILRINDYISGYSTHQISYVKTITGCKTRKGSNIIAAICTVQVYSSVQCTVLMNTRTQLYLNVLILNLYYCNYIYTLKPLGLLWRCHMMPDSSKNMPLEP
jgi:hypothetical protein